MEKKSVLSELERIAEEIVSRSQGSFDDAQDSVGGDVLTRGLDSLDLVDYLMAIEEEFGYRVSDEEIEEADLLRTDNMASFLSRRVSDEGS